MTPTGIGRSLLRAALIIVGVGILLGLVAAIRTPPPGPPPEEIAVPPPETRPSFASYFVHFFPGRTPDGARPSARRPLLRASKFLAGEHVGLRVQTAPEFVRPITVELRFLTADTREEIPSLRDDRQRFRIRRGLRTYCCLRIPREIGSFVLALLVEDEFLATYPITIKEPPRQLEGGLFAPIQD